MKPFLGGSSDIVGTAIGLEGASGKGSGSEGSAG